MLPMLGLVDYDPDGIGILRCYRYGSERLRHERESQTPSIAWLGIKSNQLVKVAYSITSNEDPVQMLANNEQASTPTMVSTSCREPISYLTPRDRNMAMGALKKSCGLNSNDACLEMVQELQIMLMLGIKAEIEWLDESGVLEQWLDNVLRDDLG